MEIGQTCLGPQVHSDTKAQQQSLDDVREPTLLVTFELLDQGTEPSICPHFCYDLDSLDNQAVDEGRLTLEYSS